MTSAKSSIVVLDQVSAPSPASTQTLSSEGVLDALKMILTDAPLNDVLRIVALLIDAHSEGMLCTIYLLDEEGLRLRFAAGPKLPDAYRVATDGVHIGPDVGSCGAAAYLRKPVFVVEVIPQAMVVMSPHGKASYANRATSEYTRLSLDEVRADDFRSRVFHPEDLQRLLEQRRRALSSPVPFENEYRTLVKDGKYRWF